MFNQIGAWLTSYPLAPLLFVVAALLLFIVLHRQLSKAPEPSSEANERAERLLRECLSPEQYQQLQQHDYFEIPSKLDPQQFYRIPRTRRRVQVFQTYGVGETVLCRKIAELCVIACEPVPDADLVLTHKWMIEGNEPAYLAIANRIGHSSDSWYMRTSSPATS